MGVAAPFGEGDVLVGGTPVSHASVDEGVGTDVGLPVGVAEEVGVGLGVSVRDGVGVGDVGIGDVVGGTVAVEVGVGVGVAVAVLTVRLASDAGETLPAASTT